MTIRRFVIGTAGHVDHGKTALVKALTGIDTDRLDEEKRRGISIELGFARWALAADLEATVVDVPGHRRFMSTMIAGASGIQLVLLVVAGNVGVMPQTREHARACYELGIRRFIVVLSKSDLVDAETLALAEAEARELIDELGRGAQDAVVLEVVACSARTGHGLASLRNTLIAAALAATAKRLEPSLDRRPARLWIDRVLTLAGAGTVVTGTLTSGAIAVGDELAISGGDELKRASVRGLRIHDANVQRAEATTRLAINVTIASKKVSRGHLVTSDLELRSTVEIDAAFRGAELHRGAVVMLHVGGARVSVRIGRVERLEGTAQQLVAIHLSAPRPIVGGDRFLLRGSATTSREGALLGGGTVLDARPPKRVRGDAIWALARALLEENAEQVVGCLLAETSPRSLDARSLHSRLALDDASLARAIAAGVEAGVLASCGAGVIGREALLALADQVRELVHRHARDFPLDRGLPIATLRQAIAERAGESAADAAIACASASASAATRTPTRAPADGEGAIRVDGDVVVPALRRGATDAAVADATERAEAAIVSAGGTGVSAFRVGEIAGPARARAILSFLVREGRAIHMGDLWFAREVVDGLRTRVLGHLSTAGKLTIAELKELGALPRKQAVLLLEHFDQTKVTRRVGETRVLFSAAAKPIERGIE